MPWYAYAIGSALFFAAQDLLMRLLAIKSFSPRASSVVFNIWGACFALIAFILQGGSMNILTRLSVPHVLLICIAIILYGLYERNQFIARKGIDAASFSIISRLSTVMAFVGSILFLKESFTLVKLAGTLSIIAASFFLVYKNPKLTLSRSMMVAIFCSVVIGITQVIDKPASAGIQPEFYSLLIWLLPLGIIAYPIHKQQIIKEFTFGSWKVALAALLNVLGYIAYIQALSMADASRVVPIMSTYGILVVLGGIILLHERDHFVQKIIAGILGFIGVYLLK